MTDREHAARLTGDKSEHQVVNFSEIDNAARLDVEGIYFSHVRTLKRLLEKVFWEANVRSLAERAFHVAFEEAGTGDRPGVDFAVHFSTGTSYCLQVKRGQDVLETPLHPLPPSEQAKRKLGRVRHDALNRPLRLPKYPLKRERRDGMVGHLTITLGDRGNAQGVLKVADRSGANEAYRCVYSDPNSFIDDPAANRLQSLAIIAWIDPERGSTGPVALVEPMFRKGSLSHSTKVVRDLDVDILIALDDPSGQFKNDE